jgi:hypothetical protein
MMYGGLSYALFVFWICGSFSVLLDIDHIWMVLKRIPPIKLGESYGRPLHTRIVFIVASCLVGLCVVTLADGLYRGILQGLGDGGASILFLCLIVITFVFTKYVGGFLMKKMRMTRWLWRHKREKPKNVR